MKVEQYEGVERVEQESCSVCEDRPGAIRHEYVQVLNLPARIQVGGQGSQDDE